MPGISDRLDQLQRRRAGLGYPLAVVYKFFDDHGNYLAVLLTYYAFLAVFPALLIASSVLGFLLQGDPKLQQQVLDSALAQFPVVGPELGRPGGIEGSVSAVVVGSLTALYGVTGLGQAAVHAASTVWAVPRNTRPNPVTGRLRSLAAMTVAGLAIVVIGVTAGLAPRLHPFGQDAGPLLGIVVNVLAALLTTAALLVLNALVTPGPQRLRAAIPGALFVAALWHLLQAFGGIYVGNVVNRVSEMNAVFAVVLGLLLFTYLGMTVAVLGMEMNVVLSRRLWPRALLTPFTDAVDLTEADRTVYASVARAQRHKGFERVEVTFDQGPGVDYGHVCRPPARVRGRRTDPPAGAMPAWGPPTEEERMTTTPNEPVADEDIETVGTPSATAMPGTDADGTDGDSTDVTDGDSSDADGTDADGTDGDSTDVTDGDSTDADGTDADGTDGDSTDVTDGDSTDADGTDA